MNGLTLRVLVLVVIALPAVLLPVQYGLPLNLMTVLAGVIWIGTIALVFWTGWPKTPR
jgi:hypothetical protein